MQTRQGPQRISRRDALVAIAATSVGAILAACGSTAAPTATPAAPPSAAATSTGAAQTTGAAPTRAPTAVASSASARTGGTPSGTLRIAIGVEFPPAVNGTTSGPQLINLGAAETLTRLTPQGALVPWLAESVTNVDPTTWRVALRKNAKFWDGSPVTADAIIAAFGLNWDKQPAASGLIPKETKITAVDPLTVEFKTPSVIGAFPSALSAQFFVIHKESGTVMTGPYRPTKFETDREMTAEAFRDHWSGAPPIGSINVKIISDANARALALQAGDLDMLYLLPYEMVKNFGSEFETMSVPSANIHYAGPNHTRPPFNDRAVREATSLALDRTALLKVAMDGQGAVATGMFPPNQGVDAVSIQSTDVSKAKQMLDVAGWTMGSDGVRAKEGKRLSFTLYSFPGRAELTPLAVGMQGQLKPLGYDIQVQEVQDIASQTRGGNFDLSMNTVNTLITGDPLYLFNQAQAKGAKKNDGGYANPQVNSLMDQLRTELDPAKRQALSRQIQEIARTDIPFIYLVIMPIITVAKKGKLKGFAPHPNNQYFIDTSFSVA